MIKNPNWQELNQLAILQAWPRIWTRHYRRRTNPASSQDSTWTSGLWITSPGTLLLELVACSQKRLLGISFSL